MYIQRAHYWTCSRIVDMIRKQFGDTDKPKAATMQEWRHWRESYKRDHPTLYWLTEKFPTMLQDVVYYVPDLIYTAHAYWDNRFMCQTHVLRTGLSVGEYHEVNTRILHGLFNTLVDFVEVETAWKHVMCNGSTDMAPYGYPWWHRYWWLQWCGVKRSPLAGIAHLQWEMSLLEPTAEIIETNPLLEGVGGKGQAAGAKEIYDLYIWWTITRPARVDPHDLIPLAARARDIDGFNVENTDGNNTAWEQRETLQAQYSQEDEDMMIRLIKIRDSMWT